MPSPQRGSVVVVVPLGIVVVVDVVGQVAAACGVHVSVRMSLSTCFGLLFDLADTVILHLPGFFPFFFSFTTMPVNAPQTELVPFGVNLRPVTLQLPPDFLTMTFLMSAAVQPFPGSFAQTRILNVHDLFGVFTPSVSHAALQSSQVTAPPFVAASGTPSNESRHSFCAANARGPMTRSVRNAAMNATIERRDPSRMRVSSSSATVRRPRYQ